MMKRKPKHEDVPVPAQAEPDMAALLASIQQQLANLERKMDNLISQGERASRPFQRPDHFRRPENRDPGNSFRERRLNKAICADCNKECEVPFKPTGDRPVYCRDCFSRRKQGGPFRVEVDKGPRAERDFTQREHSDKRPRRRGQRREAGKPVSRRKKARA
jgi:CxxC-x17-CxxC domain-containing protein